ncbi:MAG: nucleotidyltransferase family protein [Clostridiales bacterium]|nr:nucleotidyltransferase family protein [Clostridiales bacterium]
MKTVGIVAEYNPFHKGHALHIEKTRELAGEDAVIVCVMSGNFIQRGEPAIFAKHTRAEAALYGGANLVLELPLPYVLSSAERFAFGAMALLDSLGCVDYVSFGCESGDAEVLKEAAELLLRPDFGDVLREEMRLGVSFAQARQRAMERLAGKPMELMERPNNILAVEYIKTLTMLGSDIEPMAIARRGAGHDETAERDGICSASAIRAKIKAGEDASDYMPKEAAALLQIDRDAGFGPITMERLEQSVLTRLRMMSEEEFACLPDMSEGLHLRLMRAAKSCGSVEEIYEAVKTKRYALSRIRRAVMCAWLGVTAEDAAGLPPYARVLAADEKGCALLRTAGKNTTVITKPAAARRLDGRGRRLFELEAAATDLYVLGGYDAENRRGGTEWEISPVIKCSR